MSLPAPSPVHATASGHVGVRERLAELLRNDDTHALPYFAMTNAFWGFAFIGNELNLLEVVSLALVAIVAAVMYTVIPLLAQVGQRARSMWFVGYLALFGLATLIVRADVLYLGTYVAIAAASLLPLLWGVVIPLLVGAAMVLGGREAGSGVLFTLGCTSAMMGLAMAFSIDRNRRERTLASVQHRNAVLAVAAERARIGRDLHDILGHSLTAIAVKGDLAARLIDRDPQAARAQVVDLVAVARQALADTRATASGLREVRAASEVASARSVLEAAGITPHIPTALPVLDDQTSELFGYVIREGVTNVVRHAEATRCWIRVSEDAVSVADDGPGLGRRSARTRGSTTASTGVAGLRDRAAALGFRIDLERQPSVDDHGEPLRLTVLRCLRPVGGEC